MCVEITVSIRDSERNYKQKFLVYDPITLNAPDPQLSALIQEAVKNFNGQPDDIRIRFNMVVE